MSDFESAFLLHGGSDAPQETSSQARKVSNVGSVDDFERLDGESIQEQQQHQHHHHDEKDLFEHYVVEGNRKTTTTEFDVDSLSSSPVPTTIHQAANVAADSDPQPPSTTHSLLDFDDDDKMFAMQHHHHQVDPAFELKSTDRPLVTLPNEPANDYQVSSTLPETTEVNLTPDPDDKLGMDEPFVNVTANLIAGGDKMESEKPPTPIYPGKLFNAQGYSINPAELDDEDDEEIVEEEPEEDIRNPMNYSPDVLHPSAPDLISDNPYQHGRELEEEEFSELTRDDSPPPRYELPDDKYKYSAFVDTTTTTTNVVSKQVEMAEEVGKQKETERVKEVVEVEREHPITSKIEELIEELTPPFAACPSAVCSKIELSKREDLSSSASDKCCPFYPSAWFHPEKLDPRVADLIYWRNVKKSGISFGTGLVVLLSLTYFSLISVAAYSLLAIMTGTLSYRIYKNVLQAVQKSTDGHPFKQYLDVDLSLSRDRVSFTDNFLRHLEGTAKSLRRLFLVEDLVDSLKFAVVLWCFTYIGAWFNGLTLVILGFVAMFTLPKVYETYKIQIDHYLHIACSQIDDVVNKIKAKIPIGKKPKQQ